MGIALSIAGLLTPLQSLANRWLPRRRSHCVMSSGLRYVSIRPSHQLHHGTANTQANVNKTARPLRVTRLVDAQQPNRAAGRLVISGRMMDVCAELDRLTALEAVEQRLQPVRLH